MHTAQELLNGRHLGQHVLLPFARQWQNLEGRANGQWLQSNTMIATGANELMAPIRDHMPVILHPEDFRPLARREETEQPSVGLLRPFPVDKLEVVEVSTDVRDVNRLGEIRGQIGG